MADKNMIHSSMFEFYNGSFFAVYTYSVADLGDDLSPSCDQHLYTAFLINEDGFWSRGDDPEGAKIKIREETDQYAREKINDILKTADGSGLYISPKDLYEGVSKTRRYSTLYPGRLRDHLLDIPDEDIVFTIARYDRVFEKHDGWFVGDQEDYDKDRAKIERYRKKRRKELKTPDRYKSDYKGLNILIDRWLKGNLSADALTGFLRRCAYMPAKDENELLYARSINVYTDDFCAEIKDNIDILTLMNDKVRIFGEYFIQEEAVSSSAVQKTLMYKVNSLEKTCRYMARRISDENARFDEDAKLTVNEGERRIALYTYLKEKNLAGEIPDRFVWEEDEDPKAARIPIGQDVLDRFHETGCILKFDGDMVEKRRKAVAVQRLMGLCKIKDVIMDYDHDTFEVTKLEIKSER